MISFLLDLNYVSICVQKSYILESNVRSTVTADIHIQCPRAAIIHSYKIILKLLLLPKNIPPKLCNVGGGTIFDDCFILFGISGTALGWLNSYILRRIQQISINGTVRGPVLGRAQFSATFCSTFIFSATNESE